MMSVNQEYTRHGNIIHLEYVSKDFDLSVSTGLFQGAGVCRLFAGRTGDKEPVRVKTALDNINLKITRGERIGVIGHNGSGKTTLLKLIAGYIQPTRGTVTVGGSIQTLMSGIVGISEHMTGDDCIKNALAINGLDTDEEESAYDDIVSFVELGEFINLPVRIYSLGMRARLEFAISTSIRPDILLIDEVLGAGDGYFSNKCAERMRNLVSRSTLLLVTHSMQQIIEFCDRAIWINEGEIIDDGAVEEITRSYEKFMMKKAAKAESTIRETEKNSIDDGTGSQLVFPKKDAERIKYISRDILPRNIDVSGNRILERVVFDGSASDVLIADTGNAVVFSISFRDQGLIRPGMIITFAGINEHGKYIWDAKVSIQDTDKKKNIRIGTRRLITGIGNYFISIGIQYPDSEHDLYDDVLDAVLYMKVLPTNCSDPPLLHFPACWSYDNDAFSSERNRISAWV